MTVVGEAEILILANDAAFDKSLEDATAAPLGNLERDADTAGADAGAALSGGMSRGIKDGESDISSALTSGVTAGAEDAKTASRGLGGDIAGAFGAGIAPGAAAAGDDIESGVKKGLTAAATDAEKGGSDAGARFSKGMGGGLGALSSLLSGIGLNLGPLNEGLDKSAGHLGSTSKSAGGLESGLVSLGRTTTKVGVVGFLATAAASLKLGTDFQATTAKMAANGNLQANTAKQISDAFLKGGSNVIYSAQEQEQAFGAVAAQLTQLPGYTQNAAHATAFMGTAMDLAEESGEGLSQVTSSLTTLMQEFQIPASKAADTADDLENASRLTGQSVDGLANTMERLKARMGVAAPSVQDFSTLLVDLQDHGVAGSRGLMVLNSATNTLLAPSDKLTQAQMAQKNAFDALPPSLQKLATAYDKGTLKAADVSKATKGLDTDQANLWKTYASSVSATDKASTSVQNLGLHLYDSQGGFVGMGNVIAQLQPKLEKMTQAQQLATLSQLFGKNASKSLLDTILAGPAAYAKAQAAVTDTAAAHHALQVQQQTLGHELDAIKTNVIDMATKFGLVLIPVVHDVLKAFSDFLGFLEAHKPVLYAVAALIGTVLVTAVAAYAYSVGVKMVNATKDMLTSIGKLIGIGRDQQASNEETVGSNEELVSSNETLAASLDSTAASVSALATQLETLTATLPEIGPMAGEAAAGLDTLGAAADEAGASMDVEAAGAAAADAASLPIIATIGLIVAAVALLAFGIYELVTHWKVVWDAIKDGAKDAYRFLDGIWHDIDNDTRAVWGAIENFFKKWWPEILGVFTGGIGLVIGLIIQHWSQISAFTEKLWHDITGFFTHMWNDVTHAVSQMVSAVGNFFSRLISGVENTVSTGVNAVVNYFTQLPSRAIRGLGNIASGIEHAFLGIADWVNNNVIQPIVHFFEGLPGQIGKALGGLGGTITNAITSAIPGGGIAKNLFHSVAGIFDEGGMVPGSGPRLAIVHGGEYVLNTDEVAQVQQKGGTKNLSVGAALNAFSPSAPGANLSPLTAGAAQAPTAAQIAAEMTAQANQRPVQISQVFNTPMNASQVANEVGWTFRTAALSRAGV